ncbi:cystathionine gamma-synthase [Dongshaea marina]|uniref:cystathionine gamma-synthase n=1 Tax=Dongshaea marina TaxID=2047966 RepID=UPI000D3E32A9|nr:cystathionine gamma-synthase [Dongshaea marina]
MSTHNPDISSQTQAVRAGIETDTQHGAITPPLYLSSNFSFHDFNEPRQYDYTRSGNPTRELLADALAKLEGGAGAVITSSGMSAALLVIQLLKSGGRLLAPHDCYGGCFRLFKSLSEKGVITVDFVDQSDEAALTEALNRHPEIVWIETPSNPLLRVIDVAKVSALAHEKGATVVVDNTFLSPISQQPLALGADIVVHSTTKYINGHSDVVGGAVIGKTPELVEDLKWWANTLGITGAPFDSLFTLRGLRTLDVRIERHNQNALCLAEYLEQHPQVESVYYPGLPSHPTYEIANKQQTGFGAIISFKIKGGVEAVAQFSRELRLFSLAESLGGVESLICHPATMTHAAVAPEDQKTAGITENLLRISVGIESAEDLQADLQQAFEKVVHNQSIQAKEPSLENSL